MLELGHYTANGWFREFVHVCPGHGCAVATWVTNENRRKTQEEMRVSMIDSAAKSERQGVVSTLPPLATVRSEVAPMVADQSIPPDREPVRGS